MGKTRRKLNRRQKSLSICIAALFLDKKNVFFLEFVQRFFFLVLLKYEKYFLVPISKNETFIGDKSINYLKIEEDYKWEKDVFWWYLLR